MARAAILDVDGTLVDSNYHHALCWYRAFREHGLTPPLWRLHRHVGVAATATSPPSPATRSRSGWATPSATGGRELFDEVLAELSPLPGARELVVELKGRGLVVVLASSSIARHLDAFLDLLDAADAWTTKDDVDESKPAPGLVEAALERAGTRDAVVVGDTPWDCEAADRAGIETIAVLTGGFAAAELLDAGAVAVYESADELRRRLAETPLAGAT